MCCQRISKKSSSAPASYGSYLPASNPLCAMCKESLPTLPSICIERVKELRAHLGALLPKPEAAFEPRKCSQSKLGNKHRRPCSILKIRSAAKLSSKAQEIYELFVQNEASREVNIDHHTKELTQRQVAHATHNCFDVAQEKTWVLMEKDSYPRFLKSTLYQNLVNIASQQGAAQCSHT
ncbi:hypothetical protein NDU88_003893 [Pleurodeles waltl]|uniref:Regulator of G-protein signaling 8 n=1 Tax=Pleurodeles waltl TaxID=8319 RepID=A0AAV7T6E6_PLEWA|nr:hypothetical protein NDU88_003893 [Pleurodeles waltl]